MKIIMLHIFRGNVAFINPFQNLLRQKLYALSIHFFTNIYSLKLINFFNYYHELIMKKNKATAKENTSIILCSPRRSRKHVPSLEGFFLL